MVANTITVTLTANMEYLIYSTNNMAEVIDKFTQIFNDMRDWCIIQLDVGSWEMSDLVTVTNTDNLYMQFTHGFTFYNEEDATAFAITHNVIPTYVRN
jgi:hypothetical protein